MSLNAFYEQILESRELGRLARIKKGMKRTYKQRPDLYLVYMMFLSVLVVAAAGYVFSLDAAVVGVIIMIIFLGFMILMASGRWLLLLAVNNKKVLQFELIEENNNYVTTMANEDIIEGAIVIDRKIPLFDQVIKYLYDYYQKSDRLNDFIKREKKRIRMKKFSKIKLVRQFAEDNYYNIDIDDIDEKKKELREEKQYELALQQIKEQRKERLRIIDFITNVHQLNNALKEHKWLKLPVYELQFDELKQFFQENLEDEERDIVGDKYKTIAIQLREGYASPRAETTWLNWIFVVIEERENESINNYNWDRIFSATTRDVMIGLGMGTLPGVLKADLKVLGYWRDYPVVELLQRKHENPLTIERVKELYQLDEIWLSTRLIEILKHKESQILELQDTVDELILSKLESTQRAERVRELLHKSSRVRDNSDYLVIIIFSVLATYFALALLARMFNLRFF